LSLARSLSLLQLPFQLLVFLPQAFPLLLQLLALLTQLLVLSTKPLILATRAPPLIVKRNDPALQVGDVAKCIEGLCNNHCFCSRHTVLEMVPFAAQFHDQSDHGRHLARRLFDRDPVY
jgi:hypothetical protein